MTAISRRKMMQSSILGTGYLLGGGVSALWAGAEVSASPEAGPPYGLDGFSRFKEYKAAKRAARKMVFPVRVDPDNPAILLHGYLCQACGHCDEVCTDQMTVSHYCKPEAVQKRAACIHCGQCTNVCPRVAITERIEFPRIRQMMRHRELVFIASTSPAVRVALGESFGLEPGADCEGKMVEALRRLGFHHVLDTTFAADMTVVEEANELIKRLDGKASSKAVLPQFTSCCPAWVSFVEIFYPSLLPHLSTTKSPVMIQGAAVKTWFAKRNGIDPRLIVNVACTPCTAKKYEVRRPEMNAAGRYLKNASMRDMDCALTCRELAQWIFESRIQFRDLPDGKYDTIMGRGSGGGIIFGNTGGVMEATLRAVWLYATGKRAPASLLKFEPVRGMAGVRQALLEIDGKPLRVAVVHGTGTMRPLLDEILKGNIKYDFIEVMACPGGCIGGGGQPRPGGNGRPDDNLRKKRIDGLYGKDEKQTIRCSADNPDVQSIYKEFLGKPLGPLSHELLHTSYRPSAIAAGRG
jgi:iron-only hydrogenase group A